MVQRCCQAVVWRWRNGITIRRRRVINCLPRLDLQGGGNTAIHPTSALPSFMSDLVNIWTGIPHSFSRTQYCALERLYSKSLPHKTSPGQTSAQFPTFAFGSINTNISLKPLTRRSRGPYHTMADDMCGPSNALQNFQKHSTVDRTLQQDRFVSRYSPSQVSSPAWPNIITHF